MHPSLNPCLTFKLLILELDTWKLCEHHDPETLCLETVPTAVLLVRKMRKLVEMMIPAFLSQNLWPSSPPFPSPFSEQIQ